MKCYACGKVMLKVDRRMEIAEMEEGATEGQMADYWAAELSGEMGSWGIGIVEYHCTSCETRLEVISDSLNNLDALIVHWHEKTRTGDYFVKYVFEYLAFNAYLKSDVAESVATDRNSIEKLKEQSELGDQYLSMINNGQEPLLQEAWLAVINELKQQPLWNSSRDYDCPEPDGCWTTQNEAGIEDANSRKGIVYSLNDWANMVEFWYAVRNNLFHAGKDPTLKRDIFIVKHAFITLNAFMRMIIREKGQTFT